MKRVVDWYFRALKFFIVACLVVMVVLVFGNVVLRYAFNTGITVSEELSRWLFVWLTFVGAVIALRDHAHLGMDSVVSRLPTTAKKVCFFVSNVLILYALWLFLDGSWHRRSSTSTTRHRRRACRPAGTTASASSSRSRLPASSCATSTRSSPERSRKRT